METTGLDPTYDKIIEIGAIKIADGKEVDSFSTLVNPNCKIDEFITSLTGITNDMLLAAPCMDNVVSTLFNFVGDLVVVGHNVNFDINFLYDEFNKYLNVTFNNNYVDTLRIARRIYPDLKNYKLDSLSSKCGLNITNKHRALSDAKIAFGCFEFMKSDIIKNNIDTSNWGIKNKFKISTLNTQNDTFDEKHLLFNKICVFTGILEKMTRNEAGQKVVDLGGICADNITKKTNFLILGNNDYHKSIIDGKSHKHKKAESLIEKGSELQILSEQTFYDLLDEI